MNANINDALNSVGAACDWCWKKGGSAIVNGGKAAYPAILGAIGGRFMGSAKIGAVQGWLAGSLHTFVLLPAKDYVVRNSGNGPHEINETTVKWLKVAGFVAEMAGPYIITYYGGNAALSVASKIVPAGWKGYFEPDPTYKYTFLTGVAIDILPVGIQVLVEYAWGKDPRHKKPL